MTNQTSSDTQAVKCLPEGPLCPHIDSFATYLREQGYAPFTVRYHRRLVAGFNRWLDQRSLDIADLGPKRIEGFVRHRKRGGHLRPGDAFTLHRLLRFLQGSGVIDIPTPPVVENAADRIGQNYADYLIQERGVADATLKNYLPIAQQFLSERFSESTIQTAELNAKDVTDFTLNHAQALGRKRAKLMVTALRSFLHFLYLQGMTVTNLAACVPTVPNWRLTSVPKSLEPEQVEQVLAHCNRKSTVGKRDFAILLLLARLGLRAGEIVSLSLDDINWEVGEITVHGKGARQARLPLPQDVGEALVDYLQQARPRCASRHVFVRSKAPLRGFASSVAISTIVRRALKRAGLDPSCKGAHLFRHSVASLMLRNGASLAEIGEILRHRHPDTTAIYAKVDLDRLQGLAQPWPGSLGGAL